MTKQEFLNGKKFMDNKNLYTYYYYEEEAIIQVDCFQGEIIRRNHHANIEKIGTKYFSYYTFVMEKRISGKINFLNL